MNKLLRYLFAVLISLTASTTIIYAENYPYRSDYLWVTTPDHGDWLYATGEKAKIEVQLYKYGMPQNGEISYSVNEDMLKPFKEGKATVKNGRCVITIDGRKNPGFRNLVLTYKDGSVTTTHHVKVGFSADKIQPYTKEPSDFNAFWKQNIDDMHKSAELTYTRELAKEYCTDKIDCWLIKLKVDRTHSVYAYLTMPKGAKAGTCPAVICPPGAGIKTIKEPLRHKYYAEQGFMRLEMEIHGLDPRLSESTFKDISSAFGSRGNNYLENGLDNRDNYYMKHVYLALVRTVDFMTSLPEWDGKNVAFQGGSQGGALSIVGAALDNRVTQCVVNHPALTDMAGYAESGRTGGYPHFNKINAMLTPEKISVMAYYDVINFARHLTCPTYITWGYNDDTCPPTTSYACWNIIKAPKESLITPINEHWTSDQTEYGHMLWIKKHLK